MTAYPPSGARERSATPSVERETSVVRMVSAACEAGRHTKAFMSWAEATRRISPGCFGTARDVIRVGGKTRYFDHDCFCDCHHPEASRERNAYDERSRAADAGERA